MVVVDESRILSYREIDAGVDVNEGIVLSPLWLYHMWLKDWLYVKNDATYKSLKTEVITEYISKDFPMYSKYQSTGMYLQPFPLFIIYDPGDKNWTLIEAESNDSIDFIEIPILRNGFPVAEITSFGNYWVNKGLEMVYNYTDDDEKDNAYKIGRALLDKRCGYYIEAL